MDDKKKEKVEEAVAEIIVSEPGVEAEPTYNDDGEQDGVKISERSAKISAGTRAARARKKQTSVEHADAQKKAYRTVINRYGNVKRVPEFSDGTSSKILGACNYALELAATINHNDPDTMMDALFNVVNYCAENDLNLTNSICMLACDVSRDDVDRWASGKRNASDPRYKRFAVTLRRICSAYRESLGAEGKVNPVIVIWWQKVYEGYREDEAVTLESGNERKLSAEEIKEKYRDLPS